MMLKMSVANQLYQLQEIDLELESNEQALSQMVSKLGESQAVVKARAELTLEQQRLDELKRQQHSLEWEIEDIVGKLATAEEALYSGRIKNPKELTSLEHEVDGLKTRRIQFEDKVLEIMEQVELATASVATLSSELERLEVEWQSQQQRLSVDIERLKAVLSDLKQKQEVLSTTIEPQAIEFYRRLRKQKGVAVAKVEQGRCRGCRILLPTTGLQRTRGSNLVQCSSCGRILFVA